MGSVVTVRITTAARWNVTGNVVAVQYQPPGAPPLRCAPDTTLGAASAHGEVHPQLPSGVHPPKPTVSSEGKCSNAASNGAPCAELRQGSFGSSSQGGGAGHGSAEADCWGRGSVIGPLAHQLPSSSEAQYRDSGTCSSGSHVNASGNGCAADTCCQHDLPEVASSGGQLREHFHSSNPCIESSDSADFSSSNASEGTQQKESYSAEAAEPHSVNADSTCSKHSSESYQERQASIQENNSDSVTEIASRQKLPGTEPPTVARHTLPLLEKPGEPEELQPGASAKERCYMPASTSIPDVLEDKQSEAKRGQGGRLEASLERAGMSLAGAWSCQAGDVLLSAGVVLVLTGVLISGMIMLVSS